MMDRGHSRTHGVACKILGLAFLFALPLAARAADGPPYDVFAKAIAPIAAAVFGGTEGAGAAIVAECTVTDATGRLAAAKGARFRIALQSPDRLRVDVSAQGAVLTACRDGNTVWALPTEPMSALASAAGIDLSTATEAGRPAPPLVPLALNAQMLAFLPVVFDVKDRGFEENPRRRVLDFGLLPEVRDAIGAEDFSVGAWIGDDFRPSRLTIRGGDYTLDIKVDKLDYAGSLPPTAWQPPADAQPLRLPAAAIYEVFEEMLGKSAVPATP